MKSYFAKSALIEGAWQANVHFDVDAEGLISNIVVGSTPQDGNAEPLGGAVLPAIPNVHSHAFQFRFAGHSEYRTREDDSFWSWREQMYASLKTLDPQQAYENARRLYRLMLRRGYSTVGEFHYVHRNEAQTWDPLELAEAHINAAVDAGLRICMIPVLYQRGGFDDRPLVEAQKRFELSDEAFLELIQSLSQKFGSQQLFTLGMAFHSLRAVKPEKLGPVSEQFRAISNGPIHIHVAEQLKEVSDCLEVTGLRPVQLLYEHADVDQDWCLIHATHLTDGEIESVCRSQAVVGLCPTTEANLGDGIFRSLDFANAGGRISIGSDSHIALCPFSEVRTLEYGQRLQGHKRAVLCNQDESCGAFLLREVLQGGCQATGQAVPVSLGLNLGSPADFVVIDTTHQGYAGVPDRYLLDRLVFGEFGSPILETFVAGNRVQGT